MKEKYGIDMARTQRPKRLGEIPPVDVAITMGCNVECPFLPCVRWEDWDPDDSPGIGDGAFVETIHAIEAKIKKLSECVIKTNLSRKDCAFQIQ